MDSGRLADLVEAAVANGGIDGVVVVRNGFVVVDSVVYPYADGAPHTLRSVTKSVVGTLIGIAIDQGLLGGVDVPVVEVLTDEAPASADELKAAMTVEHLLTMSSGMDCRDSYLYEWEGLAAMMESGDWVSHVLALPMAEEPGTNFEYCNGASLLLSAIVSEVTGRPASEFAREVLFEPLGISEFEWDESPGGVTTGWSELWLNPDDLSRLGLLYLRGGEWEGEQLVSRDWVEAATTGQVDTGVLSLSEQYGYHWWVDDAGYSMALGYGGQHIFVAPDQNLVVVFVASLPGERSSEPEEIFNAHVRPSIVSDGALPPNEDGNERLSAVIAAARSGPAPRTPELPDTARTVDGVRYEVEPNEMGLDWLEVRFDAESAIVDVGADGSNFPLEVGMNGRFTMNELPDEPPIALRGAWNDAGSLVIEFHYIGELQRGTWELEFDGDELHAVLTDEAGEFVIPLSGRRRVPTS